MEQRRWLGVLVGLALSCGGEPPGELPARQAQALTDGRSLQLELVEAGELVASTITVGDPASDAQIAQIVEALTDDCELLATQRFDTLDASTCDVQGRVRSQQLALCEGHRWATLASSVVPIDFFTTTDPERTRTTFEQRRAVEVYERPSELIDMLIARGLVWTIPTPTNDSATTLRLLAVDAFRRAALDGSELLDPAICPDGSLTQEVPRGVLEGEGLDTETVAVARVITNATVEAMVQMKELAESAEEGVLAEAQARMSEERDELVANLESWRGAHNSRAASLALWTGGAVCPVCRSTIACGIQQFCECPETCIAPDGSVFEHCVPVGEQQCSEPEGDPDPGGVISTPPVCPPEATGGESEAIDTLRNLAVDPRLNTARTDDDILRDVRDAFIEDHPSAFSGTETMDPSAWIETHMPFSAAEARRAAAFLRNEASVLGRVIAPGRIRGSVVRVRGTEATHARPSTAHVFARGSGSLRFDDSAALAAELTRRGSKSTETHSPPRAYADRGVLNAIDVIGARLRQALERDDVRETIAVDETPFPGSALYNAALGLQMARDSVPGRLRLDVGRPVRGGVSALRFRLYGYDDADDIELWWGTEGLRCALDGEVAGEACDPDEHRVMGTRAIVADPTTESGFDEALEILVSPRDVPGGTIDERGRVFITRGFGTGRQALTGVGVGPGPHVATWSRSVVIPMGTAVLDLATAGSMPDPDDCGQPELCCAGLPCNVRLPLENELFQPSTNRDELEESFAFYMRQARVAADEADTLGLQMVEQGLQMDIRAEAARDELEDLCGGVINVGSLGPRPCANDDECGTGTCIANICHFPDGLAQSIDAASPDTTSLAACMGEEGLTSVSLGHQSLCYFDHPDMRPCQCAPGDTCPACPIVQPAEGCSAAFPGLDPEYGTGLEIEPLGLGGVASNATAASSCTDFAILRGHPDEDEREAAAERILDAAWLNESTLRTMGEYIGYRPDLYQMGAVTRGGATWLYSGTESDGPLVPAMAGEDAPFPCDPHLSLTSEEVATLCGGGSTGPALLCGVERDNGPAAEGCENVRDRININARLMHAASVLAALGGASGSQIQLPGYRTHHWDEDTEYTVHIDDWQDPLGRPGGDASDILSAAGSGCTQVGGSVNRWIRVRDSFFKRSCARSGASCDSVADCISGLEVDDSWTYLPQQALPAWLTSEYPEVAGSPVMHFVDARGRAPLWRGDQGHLWSDPTARCVFVDGDGVNDATHLALGGAICPNYFARVPGRFEPEGWNLDAAPPLENEPNVDLRRSTDGMRTAFWSKWEGFSFDGEDYATLQSLLQDVADGVDRWDPVENLTLREFPAQSTTYGRALDALELACIASSTHATGCPADPSNLPDINSLDDVGAVQGMLECMASNVDASLSSMVLFDVPQQIADDLTSGELTGTYPAYSGAHGQTVAELRSAIELVRTSVYTVSATLRNFGNAIKAAAAQQTIQDESAELQVLETASATANYAASCYSALAGSASSSAVGTASNLAAAAVTCANAAVQIGLAWQMLSVQENIGDAQTQLIYIELSNALAQGMDSLAAASSNLSSGVATIQGLLAQLDQQRGAAERLAAQVMFAFSDDSGREYNVNRSMRVQMNTLRIEYERQRRRAIHMAWMARHALQARLGIDLSTLSQDMAHVEAPATWVDRLCTMPAIDYDEIRDVTMTPTLSYAERFVGTYVDQLEDVWKSYFIDFNFQDGEDVAAISLRDQIYGISVECEVEGDNLLRWSVDPSVPSDGIHQGWTPVWEEEGYGITSSPVGATPFLDSNVLAADGSLLGQVVRALGSATGQRLQVVDAAVPPANPLTIDPRWAQRIVLGDGPHLLSWYERLGVPDAEGECPGLVEPTETLLVPYAVGDEEAASMTAPTYLDPTLEPWMSSCWRRALVVVDNPREQTMEIAFGVRADPSTLPDVVWAAPQLEAQADMSLAPLPFFPTDDDHSYPVGLCEDSNGQVFRDQHWEYGCERLCADGFAGDCAAPETHCFWETNFDIRLPQIENGTLIEHGGFAIGNYNYRTLQIGVNVVGTGVRDCSTSERPSTCNASASIPFSIRHDGPFRVRNHFGGIHDAPLYVAHIEHARALAAERYLTNPVSSADRALLQDYMRHEYLGRPIDGSYRLRIWDTEGFRWDRVRDVQVLLDYRYWTRTE